MVFLSETIVESAETISKIVEIINILQPILDFMNSVGEILVWVISGVGFILCGKLIKPRLQFRRFVNSVYSQENLREVLKYYIRTRAQDMDPCEQEEIKENNGKYISCNLISFFVKDAFKKSSSGKYYLVLADSGMGKTTFLLRLYKESLRVFNSRRKPKVMLIPLTDLDCLDRIKQIPNPENVILLLDALDENKTAISNCNDFFENLITATSGFNKIVITCRTQFFPSNKEEPSYTNYIQVGRRNKKTEIVKKYLAPFTDEEVKLYLKKRFRFKFHLQRRAFAIIQKVPNIMARPLILNWINFLCDAKEDYRYSYQIYDTIITKWIEREALGHTERNLFELSRAIADYMFNHETTTIPALKVEEIANKKAVDLEPIIAKSRSLLNRNGQGEYKFAHRTFLEYFIVFGIFEKNKMPEKTSFLWRLSGAKRFLLEILVSSVEASYPDTLAKIEMELGLYWEYTGTNKVAEFIQNPKLRLFERNNSLGFTVEAWQSFEDNTGLNLMDILGLNETFESTAGAVHKTIKDSRMINIGLIFTVHDNSMPPCTTLELRCKKTTLSDF